MPEGGVGIVRWFLWSDEVVVENGAGLTAARFSGYDGATTEYPASALTSFGGKVQRPMVMSRDR